MIGHIVDIFILAFGLVPTAALFFDDGLRITVCLTVQSRSVWPFLVHVRIPIHLYISIHIHIHILIYFHTRNYLCALFWINLQQAVDIFFCSYVQMHCDHFSVIDQVGSAHWSNSDTIVQRELFVYHECVGVLVSNYAVVACSLDLTFSGPRKLSRTKHTHCE